jgi:acetylornithine deacetylase
MREQIIGLLQDLVAFDTTSSRTNRPLIDFTAERLCTAGAIVEIRPTPAGDKAALIARIGPDAPGGFVLSGHTDTVPVAGQAWSGDPFTLRREDGRLTGRGAADMKGFIAVVLAMAPLLRQACRREPVHVALSYDEEVGCLAAAGLVAALAARAVEPRLVIVGEPSEMRVAVRHRGIHTFITEVHGRAAHSGLAAAGISAIAAAAAWISELYRLAGDLPAGNALPGPLLAERTTVNVGSIEGGTAVNIIPAHCRFTWECRPAAAGDADALLSRLAAFSEAYRRSLAGHGGEDAGNSTGAGLRIAVQRGLAVPPLTGVQTAGPALALALALAGGYPPAPVPFASEAGYFAQAGWPTIVCGPGSPRQAHQADEFISIAQVDDCVAFFHRLAASLH